jgi:uncharacterized RDD family membrane protein YckC
MCSILFAMNTELDSEQELQDREQQKKINTRLAVGIGVGGLGCIGVFYVLFFLVMFLRPGLLFSIMPSPEIATSALSDGSRTYLLFQQVDMRKVSPGQNRPPETKYFLAPVEGSQRGKPVEVPAYASAVSGEGRLYFLFDGGYRVYENNTLREVRNNSIGRNPVAAPAPDGIYVLSFFEEGPRLALVHDKAAASFPLPAGFVKDMGSDQCACPRMVWYRGSLCLFWQANNNISWTAWNGSAWASPAASPASGGYSVLADAKRLYFFLRQGKGPERTLSLYTYENNDWTGPHELPVPPGFMDWNVFLAQGKPMLFFDQFTTQTIAAVRDGSLVDVVRLRGPFHPLRMFGSMALFSLASYALTILVIFGVSALINKYKERFIATDGIQYQFASLFRRFLAYVIDTFVLLLPSGIAIAVLFKSGDITRNPLLPVMVILGVIVFFVVGGYLYHSFLEGLLGATLGKWICRIEVRKADLTPCTLGAGFLRNLLRIVDGFFYYLVGVVLLAATFKWQRLGDMAAETVVVRKRGVKIETES